MPLDALEESVNAITDDDASWWPFIWLRPDKHAPLSLRRQCMLAVLYGTPGGLLLAMGSAVLLRRSFSTSALVALAFPMLLLFVATAFVGPMWNRRAQRLRGRS